MTQDSLFHSGQQRGDARAYSASEFHNVMTLTHLGREGFVVTSGSSDVLQVSYNAGQVLDVQDGSAFIAGVYYNNSAATTVTLEDNGTIYTRIDRVVVRVDWSAQTARIVAKRGTASAYPEPPELVQEAGTLYELPLALVFVTPSFAGFGDEYIIDERPFSLVPDLSYHQGTKNVMYNSEFLSPELTGTTYGLTNWQETGGGGFPSVVIGTNAFTKFDTQSRGNAPYLYFTANDAIGSYVWMNNSTSRRITLSFAVRVTRGELLISVDGGATLTYRIRPTSRPIIITYRTSLGSAGGNQMIIPYLYATTTTECKIGQVTLTFGNVAAPFMPKHEFVVKEVRGAIISAGTGTTKVDYSQLAWWPGIRNTFVRFEAQESNTAADVINTYLQQSAVTGAGTNEYMRIELGRHVNSIKRYTHGMMCPELEYSNFAITNVLNTRYWKQLVGVNDNVSLSCSMQTVGVET